MIDFVSYPPDLDALLNEHIFWKVIEKAVRRYRETVGIEFGVSRARMRNAHQRWLAFCDEVAWLTGPDAAVAREAGPRRTVHGEPKSNTMCRGYHPISSRGPSLRRQREALGAGRYNSRIEHRLH